MSKSLFVGGKEYVPSAELAKIFGYTSDYVSRLAREKKVIAACIDRKWFIEKASLETFVQLSNNEKNNRRLELKKQRKVEQMMYATQKKNKIAKKRSYTHVALAQSVAVLMCGVFVGMLGFIVSGSNMDMSMLTEGMKSTRVQIATAVLPRTDVFGNFSPWTALATVFESIQQNSDVADQLKTGAQEQKIDNPFAEFSDEIDIIFEDENGTVLRPVFRDGTYGPSYRISRENVQ